MRQNLYKKLILKPLEEEPATLQVDAPLLVSLAEPGWPFKSGIGHHFLSGTPAEVGIQGLRFISAAEFHLLQ